jgi:hypothetical protein
VQRDRRPKGVESRHEQREDCADDSRAEGATPSLVDMPDCEERNRQRRCAPPAEPRGQGPDEVAAKQELLAESGGQRHPTEPIQLCPRVRHEDGEFSDLLPHAGPCIGAAGERRDRIGEVGCEQQKHGNGGPQPPAVGYGESERRPGSVVRLPQRGPDGDHRPRPNERPCPEPRPRPSRIGLRSATKCRPKDDVVQQRQDDREERHVEQVGERRHRYSVGITQPNCLGSSSASTPR